MTLWTDLASTSFTVRRVRVGAWSTRLLEAGTGTPLILMHGTGGHLEAFARNIPAQGARIIGKKIGLTSEAVQHQVGVDRPDFGVLFDDMRYASGDRIPLDRLMQPRAEPRSPSSSPPTSSPPPRPPYGRLSIPRVPPSRSSTAVSPTGRS